MDDETVVALVVLRPASGRRISPDAEITAATLDQFSPDRSTATRVRNAFLEAGFHVGRLFGIGMTLSGSKGLFESHFGVYVSAADDGGWIAKWDHLVSRELPLTQLPSALASCLQSVCFEEPATPVEEDVSV